MKTAIQKSVDAYSEAQAEWNGVFGDAYRCVGGFEKAPGAWLGFERAFCGLREQNEHRALTVGEVYRAHLRAALARFEG